MSQESDSAETEQLLRRASTGDHSALENLFNRHRERLRRAIRINLDARLAARIDASDIVQETYLEAARRLPDFAAQQPLSFYLWLRWLARDKVAQARRRHVDADKRSIRREAIDLPIDSSAQLVRAVTGTGTSPSQQAANAELAEWLRLAIDELDENERELILWRHFEQLSNTECASLLRISEPASSKRYVRAVEKLRRILLRLGQTRSG